MRLVQGEHSPAADPRRLESVTRIHAAFVAVAVNALGSGAFSPTSSRGDVTAAGATAPDFDRSDSEHARCEKTDADFMTVEDDSTDCYGEIETVNEFYEQCQAPASPCACLSIPTD